MKNMQTQGRVKNNLPNIYSEEPSNSSFKILSNKKNVLYIFKK